MKGIDCYRKYFLKYLLSCLLIMITSYSFCEKRVTDSLLNTLEATQSDTVRLKVLFQLFILFQGKNPEKALQFAYQRLALAEQLINSSDETIARLGKEAMAGNWNMIGIIDYYKGNYQKAMENYLKSVKIYKELLKSEEQGKRDIVSANSRIEIVKYQKGMSNSLNNIGAVYERQGNYDKALTRYLQSLAIRETIEDEKGISESLNNITIIHAIQGDYDKAMDYHKRALKINKALLEKSATPTEIRNNRKRIGHILNNMGLIYENKGDYDKAINYYRESLEIREDLEDYNGVANSFMNIGNIHNKQGKYKKAIDVYLQTSRIFERLGNKQGIASCLGNIGMVYINYGNLSGNRRDYKKALKYSKNSLIIAKEIGAKEVIKNAYWTLTETFEKLGDIEKAYENYKLYASMKDSIFNKENKDKIAELQTIYESEKKDKEIQLKNKKLEILYRDKEISRYKRYALAGSLFFILLLAIIIIGRQRLKNRKNREIDATKQKLLRAELRTTQQNLQHKEKYLSNLVSQIIHKNELLNQFKQRLKQIQKNSISNNEYVPLSEVIEKNIGSQRDWQDFMDHFELIHKDFFRNLKISFPRLTPNELRLCSLLKLNIATKEIAGLLNITPDSVKIARKRLRKKLSLNSDENLNDFMIKI